jgi:hypothetical protein
MDSRPRAVATSLTGLGSRRAISLVLSSRQAVLEFALGMRSITSFRHTVSSPCPPIGTYNYVSGVAFTHYVGSL